MDTMKHDPDNGMSDLQKLYPEEEIRFNHLTVVVRALPARKALKLSKSFLAVQEFVHSLSCGMGKTGRSLTLEIVRAFRDDVAGLLEESVSVKGMNDVRALDLPVKIFPEMLLRFIRLNFDVGNFRALVHELGLSDTLRALSEGMKTS
jgi:hypothetical protein